MFALPAYTWSQPSSLNPSSTFPWTPRIPASSNCVTYQSTDLFPLSALGYQNKTIANAAAVTSSGSSSASGAAATTTKSGSASASTKTGSSSGVASTAVAAASTSAKSDAASTVVASVGLVGGVVAGLAVLLV